jgi:hypothetical protein
MYSDWPRAVSHPKLDSRVPVGAGRMMSEFGKADLIEKAHQQPGKVKVVLARVKTGGECRR